MKLRPQPSALTSVRQRGPRHDLTGFQDVLVCGSGCGLQLFIEARVRNTSVGLRGTTPQLFSMQVGSNHVLVRMTNGEQSVDVSALTLITKSDLC